MSIPRCILTFQFQFQQLTFHLPLNSLRLSFNIANRRHVFVAHIVAIYPICVGSNVFVFLISVENSKSGWPFLRVIDVKYGTYSLVLLIDLLYFTFDYLVIKYGQTNLLQNEYSLGMHSLAIIFVFYKVGQR
jgi:hypothetical protein